MEQQEADKLIRELIKKEAEIKKTDMEIKNSEKLIKKIKKSKTWQRSNSVRKWIPSGKAQKKYISQLEKEITNTKNELVAAQEMINELRLENSTIDYNSVWRMAKEQKDESKLVDLLDKIIQKKKRNDENYNHLLKSSARLFEKEKLEYKQYVYLKILSGLKVEDIPEFMIRSGLSEENISLKQASSYRASLNMRMRQNQLLGTLPEMLLDDKKMAYSFMNKLNIRIPRLSDQTYRLQDIPEKEGIVIKPVDGAGGRGVYLVYSNRDIIDIKNAKTLANWQLLRKSLERDITSGQVSTNEWFVEEFILENKQERTPARDLKFYCFYGKVSLILEIVRYPELKYCWWTTTGERVATGKYDYSSFKGIGVTRNEIEMAAAISAEIPAPFIRIDFLRSEDGLVFGEFTPKPGNYDDFDDETDKWLGDYFIEAQGRLENDLIDGKRFTHYKELKENSN
ncbi:ATP-grasp fold amidoligase family protein [Oceanobacillus longus]|uniref:ATP-grasp fold amidoligase family protein n=1 Tax=Oceanobacillus longus TaxID=930120 RepID=A0ABV8GYT2_9BACI